ncbi:MAG: ATP-grasp domain-containing protein [Nitrospirota bacterium]
MAAHRVLITAIGGNIGQGILKSLRAANRDYYIVGIDMHPLSAGFSLADAYYTVSKTGSPTFYAEIKDIITKEHIEAIYVCVPPELEYFSLQKEIIRQELGVEVFVNPVEVVRIGSDKLLTSEFLKNNSFPYPETHIADDDVAVERMISAYGFPLIMKPRLGSSSKNIFIVRSLKEIEAAKTLAPDMLIQRYLVGDDAEYTATTVADKKVFASIVLHRDLLAGTTFRTELIQDDSITAQITAIANALGTTGACNFQFRLLDGQVYVFEINPRFSGTNGIRYLYGFNDAEMVFEVFKLNLTGYQPKLHPAVVLRYWNEIYIENTDFKTLSTGTARHDGLETVTRPLLKRP